MWCREAAASWTTFDLEQVADRVEVVSPVGIGAVPSKERLGVVAPAASDWFDVSDDLAAACDGIALTVVLDRVEEVGEPSSGFGCRNFGHGIRLSDSSDRRRCSAWPVCSSLRTAPDPAAQILTSRPASIVVSHAHLGR